MRVTAYLALHNMLGANGSEADYSLLNVKGVRAVLDKESSAARHRVVPRSDHLIGNKTKICRGVVVNQHAQ